MRAQFLGSTAVTVRVRCRCGHKADFYRYFWQRRGYVICDRCKSFILYHSLEVRDAGWQGVLCLESQLESQSVAGELETQRLIEAELRDFLQRFYLHPEWQWAPRTVQLVRAVEPSLELLDELRGRKPGA